MFTVSSPGFASAAASASRTEQSPGSQLPMSSSVVVTLKVFAAAGPATARSATQTSAAIGASLICILRSEMTEAKLRPGAHQILTAPAELAGTRQLALDHVADQLDDRAVAGHLHLAALVGVHPVLQTAIVRQLVERWAVHRHIEAS